MERRAATTVIVVADLVNETGDASNDAVAFAAADIAAGRIATSKRAVVKRWRGKAEDVAEEGAIIASGRIIDDAGRAVLSVQIANADDDAIIAGRTIPLDASGVVEAGSAIADETASAAGLRLSAPPGASSQPDSAVADPGPKCYRRNGPLTVTEAKISVQAYELLKKSALPT